jgi:hypothetical protein
MATLNQQLMARQKAMQNDKKAKVDDSDDSDDVGEQDDWDNDSESD